MAERVPKITEAEKPTFDAAVYSDRLQETRLAEGALPAVQVFDKTKPASIVPLAQYVKTKLTDTVNALSEFTAALKVDYDKLDDREAAHHAAQALRISAVEEAVKNPPFPG